MISLTIHDETALGQRLHTLSITLKSQRVTVRDLISARVEAEVQAYNERLPTYFKGLVQPSEAEQTLNGFRLKQDRKIDPEKQVYIALDAFQKNGYFVLVNDMQVEELDEVVEIDERTAVSFVKLTPLVGG